MAVTSFVTPTAAVVEQESWYTIATTGAELMLPVYLSAGLYRFRAYANALNATPTVTYKVYNSSETLASTVTSVDIDTGNGANYSEAIISCLTNDSAILVNTNTAGYVTVQKVGTNAAIAAIATTTYQTSQTITLTAASSKVALFGGGGGATNGNGGAGSGYVQKFNLGPGSYALVAGAGGSPGSNGGQSTFAGYTASGGSAPNGANGGAGGSGGGGANYGSSTQFAGGKNGANGASSGYGTGGTGSGATRPWYIPDVNGVYAGGGGSAAWQDNVSGYSPTGIGGGGGSGRDYYTTMPGGTGAAGGVVIF